LSSKLTPESAKHRAKAASLSRVRPASDPAVLEAKAAMRTAMMVEFIEEQIAKAPPLSDEQVATIRAAIRQTAQRRA
jgi:hypothetical protein